MAASESVPEHHVRKQLCATRPKYREGRQPKAVKVYTVAQESQYLLVQGVPAVGAQQELVKLFALYGTVDEYRVLHEYPNTEQFTEVYWVKFQKIQAARFAKRKLDDFSFFGGVLHVSYAPEFESIEETETKLDERRRVIAAKTRKKVSAAPGPSSVGDTFLDEISKEQLEKTSRLCSKRTHVVPDKNVVHSEPSVALSTPLYRYPPPASWQMPPQPVLPQPPLASQLARLSTTRNPPPLALSQAGWQQIYDSQSATVSDYYGSKVPGYNCNGSESLERDSSAKGNDANAHNAKISQPTIAKFDPNKVIVKTYNSATGAAPKFTPRQLKSKESHKRKLDIPDTDRDDLNTEIKRNAVILRDKAGPTLPSDSLHRRKQEKDAVDRSMDETRSTIRNQLKRVSVPVKTKWSTKDPFYSDS